MKPMDINMIYITAESKDEARMIGKKLVSNRGFGFKKAPLQLYFIEKHKEMF
jgi:hypothetical protein